MSKWICIHNGDEQLVSIVENALKDHGYQATRISRKNIPDPICADLALICDRPTTNSRLTLGNLTIDLDSITAYTDDGVRIHFTPIEFSMLALLFRNAHRAVSRSELLPAVWGFENSNNSRVADDTAKRLRRKLSATTVVLETVWNYGFRVRENQTPKGSV